MVSLNSKGFAEALVLGTGLLLVAGYLLFRNKKRRERSRTVGKVAQLRIYPIKSGPTLFVDTAECTEAGLKYKNVFDRQFVLIGNTGYINIVKNLRVLKLKMDYNEETDCLDLQAPGMEKTLSIPLQIPEYDPSKVKSVRWYDNRETFYFDYGSRYGDWLSEVLEEPCRLGYSHPEIVREVNPNMTYNSSSDIHPQTKIGYAASHPYLVATQPSLDDINSKVEDEVTMDSFRPNIVVTSDDNSPLEPFEEDNWREMYVGEEAILYGSRMCPRCPTIYVDFESHKMRANKEPMTTLLKYRRGTQKQDRSKSVFGINSSLIKRGMLSVGDKFTALLPLSNK